MGFMGYNKGCGLLFIGQDSGSVMVFLLPSFPLGIVAGCSSMFFSILTSRKEKKIKKEKEKKKGKRKKKRKKKKKKGKGKDRKRKRKEKEKKKEKKYVFVDQLAHLEALSISVEVGPRLNHFPQIIKQAAKSTHLKINASVKVEGKP